MKNRRLRMGAMATGFIIFFIAAMILFNLVAGIASDRFYWKWDMTREQLYSLSDETENYLTALPEPVKAVVLATESHYMSYSQGLYMPIGEMLKKYASIAGSRLELEFLDPDLNSAALEKYSSLGQLSAFDIIIASDKRFRILRSYDLMEMESDVNEYYETYTYPVGYQAERKLTSAVMHVCNEIVPQAAFLGGHGERTIEEMADLRTLLEDNNYTTLALNLPMEDIPDDVNLLVIAAPQMDFSPAEAEKLENFFTRGGDAWFFFGTGVQKLPVLERYLGEWGVAFEDKVLFDSVNAISNQSFVVPTLGDHAILGQVKAENMLSVLPYGRPIEILFGERNYRTTFPLLSSSANSYAKSTEAIDTYEKEAGDASGPFPVAVLTEQRLYDSNLDWTEARVLSMSVNFVIGGVLQDTSLLNVRIMNSIAVYCNPIADTFYVSPKVMADSTMSLTINTAMVLMGLLVILLPLLIFGAGLAVWLRRRHL